MFIIKHKTLFLTISATIVGLSILSVLIFGLKFGIDFRGGAHMEVAYTAARPAVVDIKTHLTDPVFSDMVVQEIGTNAYSIKTGALTETQHAELRTAFTNGFQGQETNYDSIGPSVGHELAVKALYAIIFVVLAIIIFIGFAFRQVSRPVQSWKYGLIAIVTLVHDIAIPSGVFALLGHFRGAEVDTLFVVALLTVLGLSVSDTIVVFDRIRENLKNKVAPTFSETVGASLSQTFTRSINTSLTVILALGALYFWGPTVTKNFSLVLIVGMFFGTYSSIFVASPLLVIVEKMQGKQK